jgi:hypothetical protein
VRKRKERVTVHAYNLSSWEAEAGRSEVPGQPRLQRKTLSKKKIKTKRMNVRAD